MSDERMTSTIPSNGRQVGSSATTLLKAENLRRVFVDGVERREVLKGVSLALQAGEVAALVGRSGCGKSTLLHLLGLLDKPDGGSVFIDGTPVSELPEDRKALLRNRKIGFVFQHYFLLPEFNLLENVLMPAQTGLPPWEWLSRRGAFVERAHGLLKRMGLSDRAGQKTTTLSGGEKQRVSLARALLLEPRILLCDEPTGNLDPETGGHIMDLIFDLSTALGTAVLVVTHDRALSNRAQRVLRLDSGVLE